MNSTDRLLKETRDAAKELNTGIHMVRSLSILFSTCVVRPFLLQHDSSAPNKVLMMD